MSSLTANREWILPILNLNGQYDQLRDEISSAVLEVLDRQTFILGPNVDALEREIAGFCAMPFAVGVASGTDALLLALRAAGVCPGDEVIVPALSFIATADTVSMLRAIPIFADIDSRTFNIDVEHAASLVTDRTRAIIPVHLFGQPAAMGPLAALASRHSLCIIEDSAQALGSRWQGRPACSLSDYGCISFFPSKNLGGCGDGGMITVRTQDQAERLRMLRSHGSRKKYYSELQGMNSRLDELQAAILRVKLPHLERWNEARRHVASMYREALRNIPDITLPFVSPDSYHVYHQFTIRVANRAEVQESLAERGVQTFVYYPVPLHLQPMYSSLGYRRGDLPVAEKAATEVLSLPMFPEMTEKDVQLVADCLEECVTASVF